MQLPSAEDFITNISFDSVIFGYHAGQLKILILEYKSTKRFALPGGFLKRDENLNDAVNRNLIERTGLNDIYQQQFYTFGDVIRTTNNKMREEMQANGIDIPADHWMLDRFISVGYYALIDYTKVNPRPDEISGAIDWYGVEELPDLILDHKEIVNKALEALRNDLEKKLITANLLPSKFTMKELQQLYEVILGKKLRRSAFQRKLLSMNVLERHEKQMLGKPNKAPYLYSYKREAVQKEE